MTQPIILTERLIIRALTADDADGIYALDTEVHRYLGNNPIKTIEEAKNVITFIQNQYIENGIGRWAIVEKDTNAFVGWTGLKLRKDEDTVNNHTNYYDLGYRLQKKYWGKGYATETAIAVLNYAFTEMKLTEIYAMADAENTGSNNVLRKVGLQFIESFMDENIKHHWYKITKEKWANKTIKAI
jgi:[ribosomal protein S5]-alanine N-acetyltransferase